jgi:EmrB/QacA subfamily drug resistance transporter
MTTTATPPTHITTPAPNPSSERRNTTMNKTIDKPWHRPGALAYARSLGGNPTTGTVTAASSDNRTVRHGAVTAVVCLALAAVTAAMSSLNVAIPDIARSTHATQTQLSWIIDAYSLVFAALLLPGGALGDRFGRRRALLAGLTIFAGGSLAAMFATSPDVLIGLRGVIGLGAALVMPATLSTITGTFPPAQRVKAVSVWAGVAGGAALLGLLVSGALLEVFSWRSAFAVNVVLAAAAIIGTFLVVPESANKQTPKLDKGGVMLSLVGLVVLVYSIIEAPAAGWLSPTTLVGIAIGLVVLAGFVAYELRQAHPLLNPRIFGRRGLSAGSASIFVQFFAFYGFIFLILQYLQIVRGQSALVAALCILPLPVTLMPTSRLAPKLAGKLGSGRLCVGGLVLIAIGLSVIAQVATETHYWVLAIGLLILGAGMGSAMTPATSAITSALPRAQQGVASAMNDLSREVGGALGIAVLGSVITATYRSHLALPGVPSVIADKARDSLGIAAHLGHPIATQANSAFVDGLQAALYLAAAAAIAAAAVVGILHRGQGARTAAGTGAELQAGGSDGSDQRLEPMLNRVSATSVRSI